MGSLIAGSDFISLYDIYQDAKSILDSCKSTMIRHYFDILHILGCYNFISFIELAFTSWQDQSEAEARELLRLVLSDDRAIVMGDLNSSPSVPKSNVDEDMPGTYYTTFDIPFRSPCDEHLFMKAKLGFKGVYVNILIRLKNIPASTINVWGKNKDLL